MRVNSNRAYKMIKRINMPNFIKIPPEDIFGGM